MRTIPLRHVGEVNPTTREFDRLPADDDVTFMPLETVWADSRIDFSRRRPKRDVTTGYTRFCSGDVLVPKVTPTFQAGRVAIAQLDTPAGAGTTELHIVRARPGVSDARFLAYVCRSKPFLDEGVSAFQGVAGLQRVPDEFLRSFPVADIPLDEQRRIADFLDTETARLDELATARRRQQPLLKERWRAEIRNELEGRGEGGTPSHAPWLARHPASWRPIRLRHLAHIQRGASPRPIDDPIYFDDDGTHAWVRISDVSASGKFLWGTDQTLSSLGKSHSVALQPGELFVSIAASVGKPVIAAIDCCIHDGFVAIRRPQASVDFLYYVLELGDCFNGLGKLGTQLNLNSDTIGSIVVALPPEREQAAIAHRLDRARESVDSMAGIIERQVGVLQERRQALITAAVTGQLDVTTARGGRS